MDESTLQEAIQAREVAAALYLRNPRVTLIDIGRQITGGVYTGELAVRIHVRKKPPMAVIESLSATAPELVIDKSSIPYTVDFIEGIYPMQWDGWPPLDPRARRFDPLIGGISVSGKWIFGYGTLGGIVTDRLTGDPLILSNWHVLAGSEFGTPGTPIFQPGFGDNGRDQDTVALLERHVFAQGIDAAVACLTGQRGWDNDQLGIGRVTGSAEPTLDMRVIKSGRRTWVTRGVVDGILGEYATVYNGRQHSIRHVIRIVPQPGEDQVSLPGDSGSWWLAEDSRQAVGLHFAGELSAEAALAIAMPQVLDALNVDIARQEEPGAAAPGIVPLGGPPPPEVEHEPAMILALAGR